MADSRLANVAQIRIESLQHNRELITSFVGGITAVYTIVFGVLTFVTDQNSSISINLIKFFYNNSILIGSILLTLAATNIFFILSIWLLTDSIHCYSKMVEYESILGATNEEIAVEHKRALAADDLSYFYSRLGTLSLLTNLCLSISGIIGWTILPNLLGFSGLIAFLCALLAFLLVFHAYRVSHYKEPSYSILVSLGRFWRPRVKKATSRFVNVSKLKSK